MDKYDKFLADVSEKTQKGSLKWDVVSPTKFQEYVFQSPFVYAAYEAVYVIGGRAYTLVFVEKKMPSTANDFDMVTEQHRCELVVIHKGKLVFTLTGDYVEYDELLDLGRLLESRNSTAEDLFKNFD